MVAFRRLVVTTQHTITAIMMNKMKRSINSPITAPAMVPLWSPTELLPVVLTVSSPVVLGEVVNSACMVM